MCAPLGQSMTSQAGSRTPRPGFAGLASASAPRVTQTPGSAPAAKQSGNPIGQAFATAGSNVQGDPNAVFGKPRMKVFS